MKISDRILLIIGLVIVVLMFVEIRRFHLWAETQQPNGSLARPFDCAKSRVAPVVRGSDGTFWTVDVCAVAARAVEDTVQSEDFKQKLKGL